MAIITALVVQQKNKQRVNVELDGSFGFGLALNLALGLRRGQMLDEAAIAALQTQDAVEMAWERVIRLLAIRARSAQEIRQYLQRNAAEPTIIDSVITRLQERNYLDDAEFAKAWVQNRTTFRPKGARVLQHELRQKGIAPEDIQTALAGLDEQAAAQQAAQKVLSRYQKLAPAVAQQHLLAYLARRGFGYQVCRAVVQQLLSTVSDDDSDMTELLDFEDKYA